MENIVLALLETARELERSNLGEFDLGKLKNTLDQFEKIAPDILRIEKEHRLMKDRLILTAVSRLSALERAGYQSSLLPWTDTLSRSTNLEAHKLIEINQALKRELNRAFNTKPVLQQTAENANAKNSSDEFKIGK